MSDTTASRSLYIPSLKYEREYFLHFSHLLLHWIMSNVSAHDPFKSHFNNDETGTTTRSGLLLPEMVFASLVVVADILLN